MKVGESKTNPATFQTPAVVCGQSDNRFFLGMCFWMEAFGTLWSAPPPVPDHRPFQHSSSHQIGRLATEVSVVVGRDSPLLSSAVLWLGFNCLPFVSLSSPYSSFNKHIFLLLLQNNDEGDQYMLRYIYFTK